MVALRIVYIQLMMGEEMFIVLLKFSNNRESAGKFMEDHKAWLKCGFDKGIFLLAGSLQEKSGGGIIANHLSRLDLQEFINTDPFVIERIVSAEIIELTPSRAIPDLEFLLA
jgi:uncharacterized protein YciI